METGNSVGLPGRLTGEEFTLAWLRALRILGSNASLATMQAALPSAVMEYWLLRKAFGLEEDLTADEFARVWAWALALSDSGSDAPFLELLPRVARDYRSLRDSLTSEATASTGMGVRLQRVHSPSGEVFVVELVLPSGAPPEPSKVLALRRK